ncbi:MAG: cytochrome c oxidase assembly protein, partial [Actinobacteria bacterium]|nr:cytochrome c oxidase assembly protein [Actinomycetota bacterium]
MIAVAVALAAFYGTGVRRLGRRRRAWPVVRSVAFGTGILALATAQFVPETTFVGHMAGHVLLGMVAPL